METKKVGQGIISCVLLLGCLLIVKLYCGKPTLETAESLEKQEDYAAAYEEYAKVIVERSEKFQAPPLAGDVPNWLSKLVLHYITYSTTRPKETDSIRAFRKLGELEPKLNSLEHTFTQTAIKKLDSNDFIDFWHRANYPNQKTLPESARKDAEAAFNKSLSIMFLSGDASSGIEGMLYSPELGMAIPFQIHYDSVKVPVLLLSPGDWVIVSRVVPELSNPHDKQHREGLGIVGQYAATFLAVPQEPYALSYQMSERQPIRP